MKDQLILQHKILLGDATDERMLRAARIATDHNLAKIILIGNREDIMKAAEDAKVLLEGISVWSLDTCDILDELITNYYETRKSKVPNIETAKSEIMSDHLLFGALIVNHGDADGMVAGSLSTSANVIRAALRGIGLAPNIRSLSSMFLMNFSNGTNDSGTDFSPSERTRVRPTEISLSSPDDRRSTIDDRRSLAFADCAVIVDPDAHQLADIAISTAATYKQLTGNEPIVAMLSYSTKGSASSDQAKKMILATEIAKEREQNLIIDGELQFDAAFVPSIANHKAPDSPVKGNANVFIFPNLDAGNIGYKIAERLGGAVAIGPILQGLAKPMNDLSRGCTVEDIVTMVRVTGMQVIQN